MERFNRHTGDVPGLLWCIPLPDIERRVNALVRFHFLEIDMSYNIDTFKLKTLDELSFPVSALYKNPRKDWHPVREDREDGVTVFTNMETELRGKVDGDRYHVTYISCYGEGSGTVMNDMLEPAFAESTGHLVASCVWEGGDCINRLEVRNGTVYWKDIEI